MASGCSLWSNARVARSSARTMVMLTLVGLDGTKEVVAFCGTLLHHVPAPLGVTEGEEFAYERRWGWPQ